MTKDQEDKKTVNRKEIFNYWLNQTEKLEINFDDISPTDKIYLGALLQEGLSENKEYINPLLTFTNSLAPTPNFIIKIVSCLFEKRAILFHKGMDTKFIEFTDSENWRYSIGKVQWILNIKNDTISKGTIIESLVNPISLNELNFEEIHQLWKKIAHYEAIEYFEFKVNTIFDVNYSIKGKTKRLLEEMINYYSVAEIYHLINKATDKAIKYHLVKISSKKHAVKLTNQYLRKFGQKAIATNKKLKKQVRSTNCPESALSKFFFNSIIKIGKDGFKTKPDINKIRELYHI